MKIKTITCHNVYNYGASLQEYALLKFLNESGHDAKAINYRPKYLDNNFKLWEVSNPKYDRIILIRWIYLFLKLPERLIKKTRKKKFDEFSEEYIVSTSQIYKNNNELKSNIPEADIYICGSDQIWNSYFPNGKDPAFYLDFVPDNKLKISYAASFAIENLDKEIKPFVKNHVSKIDYISVRESSGMRILKELGISNIKHVLDPVFLLEKEYWLSHLKDEDFQRKDFVLVYDFDNNPEIKKLAIELKRENKLQIYALNQQIRYADKNFFLQGPNTFLALVNSAKFILTNSFHAVAFSIIFKKQFAVFNRNEHINTRMRDFLYDLSLQDRLISTANHYHELKSIDYEQTYNLLAPRVEVSKSFLTNSISQVLV